MLIPPPPNYPPASAPAPARDWLDDILDRRDVPPAPAGDEPVGGGRLPDWRKPKPALTPASAAAAALTEDEPEQPEEQPQPDAPEDADPAAEVDVPKQPAPAAVAAAGPEQYVIEIRTGAEQAVKGLLSDPEQRRRVALVLYNGGAAGVGWIAGIAPWMHASLLYYGQADTDEGVWVGVGVIAVCLIAEIRTHGWRHRGKHVVVQFLGWIARIPLASAVLALAWYGPDATL